MKAQRIAQSPMASKDTEIIIRLSETVWEAKEAGSKGQGKVRKLQRWWKFIPDRTEVWRTGT